MMRFADDVRAGDAIRYAGPDAVFEMRVLDVRRDGAAIEIVGDDGRAIAVPACWPLLVTRASDPR